MPEELTKTEQELQVAGQIEPGMSDFQKANALDVTEEQYQAIKEGQVTEKSAQGQPTVVESDFKGEHEKYYLPGSTPHESGLRTESESRQYSAAGRPLGVHAGKGLEDTVIIMEGDKPVARFTQKEIGPGGTDDISAYVTRDAVRYPVTNQWGKETLLTTNQVNKINQAEDDKQRFELYKEYGVIAKDEPYRTAEETKKQRETQSYKKTMESRPSGELKISNADLEAVRNEASILLDKYGRWDLTNKDAPILRQSSTPKGKIGYDLGEILARGNKKEIEAVKLLFSEADIDKAKKSIQGSTIKQADAVASVSKPNATILSKYWPAITAAGAIAVAEPTPMGEIVLAAALVGGLTIAYMQGQKVNFAAEMHNAIVTFKEKMGRKPTAEELSIAKTAAVEINRNIPAFPITSIEAKIPPITAARVSREIPPFPISTLKIEVPPLTRVDISSEIPPFTKTNIEAPKILIAATQVAIAEKELGIIIRPSLNISEFPTGKYLPETTKKTSLALVALDKAVREAQQKGEISDEAVRRYYAARRNYLAKRQLLDNAMKTYTGGMQPKFSKAQGEEISLAITKYLSQARKATHPRVVEWATPGELQKIAEHSITESLTKGLTLTQAMVKAQEAVQTATRTQTQTQTQTQAKAQTKTATQTATKTATRAATREMARTTEAAMEATASATSTTGTFRLPSGSNEKQKREFLANVPGLIARRRGELGGQSVWRVWHYPYGPNDKTIVMGSPPAGAKTVTGKGSVKTSATVIKGLAPTRNLYDDTGAVDDIIIPAGKRSIRIESVRDMGISQGSPRISERTMRISPKIPRLR